MIRKIPPNFAELSDDERRIIEESIYRNQLFANHGFCASDYEGISKVNNLDKKMREMEVD